MSLNLIEMAKGLLSNELIGKAGAYLNESESGIAKAAGGILPAVFSGLMNKTSTNEGANMVAQMASEQGSSGILDNLGSLFSGGDNQGLMNKAPGILSNLFGNKADMLSGLIGNFSGIKSSSATSLLGMIAPVVLSFLGKHASSNNLNAGGIASLLNSQKQHIANAMPAGLNLGSILNMSGDAGHTAKAAAHSTYEDNNRGGGGMKWLLPILILALLGAAAWYMFKDGCNKKTEDITVTHDSGQVDTHSTTDIKPTTTTTALGSLDSLGNWVYSMGNNITLELPNNVGKMEVGENSTEAKLIRFLMDKNATLDTVKGNWYEFTNVRFKTGSADITDESMQQLKNMVIISKAFPAAKFKLGGYTDNTGDPAKNVALSQKRADAVAAMLKKLGAAASSLDGAKGYGPEHPIADNSTAEGRAQNRRVATNVKAK